MGGCCRAVGNAECRICRCRCGLPRALGGVILGYSSLGGARVGFGKGGCGGGDDVCFCGAGYSNVSALVIGYGASIGPRVFDGFGGLRMLSIGEVSGLGAKDVTNVSDLTVLSVSGIGAVRTEYFTSLGTLGRLAVPFTNTNSTCATIGFNALFNSSSGSRVGHIMRFVRSKDGSICCLPTNLRGIALLSKYRALSCNTFCNYGVVGRLALPSSLCVIKRGTLCNYTKLGSVCYGNTSPTSTFDGAFRKIHAGSYGLRIPCKTSRVCGHDAK